MTKLAEARPETAPCYYCGVPTKVSVWQTGEFSFSAHADVYGCIKALAERVSRLENNPDTQSGQRE